MPLLRTTDLLDNLMESAYDVGPEVTPPDPAYSGTLRANERLVKLREKNATIPTEVNMTRQQMRALQRRYLKSAKAATLAAERNKIRKGHPK